MLCVNVNRSGEIVAVTPQPESFSDCSYVIVSGAYISNSPFSLTIEQAQQIGGAILLLWGVAFGIRSIARIIIHSEKE